MWRQLVHTVGSSFVSNASTLSCVDTKITGLEHTMAALLGVIRKPHVQEELNTYRHPTTKAAATAASSPDAIAAAAEYAAAAEEIRRLLAPLPPVTNTLAAESAPTGVTAQPLTPPTLPPTQATIGQIAADPATTSNALPAPTAPAVIPSPRYCGGFTHEDLHGTLRKAGAYQLIDEKICNKVEQPLLHIDKTKLCPSYIPMRCTHGENGDPAKKCRCCGIHCLPILSALSQSKVSQEVVEAMVWGDSIRQGDKKGKQKYTKGAG